MRRARSKALSSGTLLLRSQRGTVHDEEAEAKDWSKRSTADHARACAAGGDRLRKACKSFIQAFVLRFGDLSVCSMEDKGALNDML